MRPVMLIAGPAELTLVVPALASLRRISVLGPPTTFHAAVVASLAKALLAMAAGVGLQAAMPTGAKTFHARPLRITMTASVTPPLKAKAGPALVIYSLLAKGYS